MGESVLVTGGAGFIGSHVAEKLVARGYDVSIVDNLSGGYIENIPQGCDFYKESCEDYEAMKRVFNSCKPLYVMHLASYAAEGLSSFIRRYNCKVNIEATVNIVNLSVNHKVKRLIYTSSMATYGTQQVPYLEEMKPEPEDPYGWAKYYCEGDIKCANKMWGIKYTLFRPHSVIGIRQNIFDAYRNVASIFCSQVLHNQPITVFGDGSQVRAFSYIDDIANPIVDSISDKYPQFLNETFNIGGDIPITILELAQIIQKLAKNDGINVPIEHHAPRVEVHTAYSDHSKLRKFYNEKSNKSIEYMVTELYNWAKTQPDRPIFTWSKDQIEIMEKLPPKWEKTLK